MKVSEALIIGKYIYKDSFFHNLNSSVKILLLLIYTVIIFFLNEAGLLNLFVIVLAFTFISHINIIMLLRGLKPIIIILFITFFLNLFFIQTGNKINIGFLGISITDDALKDGSIFSMQIMLAMFFASLLTLTTTPKELVKGLETILLPLKIFKFPVMQISLMLVIALKFIPITLQELEHIINSQKIRGINFKNLRLNEKLFYFVSMIIPLFVVTLKKTEHLAVALDMKCFNLFPKKFSFEIFKMKFSELLFLLLNFIIIFLIIYKFHKTEIL